MRGYGISATLLLVLAAGGSTLLTAGCGSKKEPGFDWTVKRSQTSGKVQATLRRFAILPRKKENLETEREGLSATPIKIGPGYYLVCEVGITVDGKPLWELPDGMIIQLGPIDFLQGNRQMTGQLPVPVSKVPAAVRNDPQRRDAWTIMMPCPAPKFGDEGQPFEVKLGLALKGNQKHSFRFESLKIPADALVGP